MTRTITIHPVLNGYTLQVGCQAVVFTDKQTMLTALSEYYDNPEEVEKRFLSRAVNHVADLPPPPQEQCVAGVNILTPAPPMPHAEPLRR